jgi:hypothetical protein
MADPLFEKTWKADVGASIFSDAIKPTNEMRLYEERPNGYKLTVTGERGGSSYKWFYEAYYDGKTHPVHGRDDADGIVIYKLDDKNTVGFFSKGIEPAGPYRRKVGLDGRSLQVEAAGRDANGQPYFNVINYSL